MSREGRMASGRGDLGAGVQKAELLVQLFERIEEFTTDCLVVSPSVLRAHLHGIRALRCENGRVLAFPRAVVFAHRGERVGEPEKGVSPAGNFRSKKNWTRLFSVLNDF